MSIKDDIAVHATFGYKVATFGISRIEIRKCFNCFFYFPVITFSLKISKRMGFITKYLKAAFKILITCYIRLSTNFFFHA